MPLPTAPAPARPRPVAFAARVWRSVFPDPLVPRDDRGRRRLVVHTLVLHMRPVQLPAATLRFTHTFGLGGSAFVLGLVLAATGLLSVFVYEPTPERAYASIVGLERDYLFGRLVRGLHHWSAHLLVVVAVGHLLRVFLTGAWHGPRRFNWLVGCALLAMVLAASFSGYLLPWDQRAYWAITVSTSLVSYVPWIGEGLRRALVGGDGVGGATLRIFHALHTSVLPAVSGVLLALHFWRVRKAGGVIVPPRDRDDAPAPQVLFVPHLLLREAALGLALLALLLTWTVAFEAPLGPPANPGLSPEAVRAPWYFAGLQELLVHVHPLFAVLVLPLCAGLALVALPYLRDDGQPAGRWFLSADGRRTAALGAALGAGAALAAVLLDAAAPGRAAAPGVFARGVLPSAVLLAGLAVFARWLERRRRAPRAERVQALFMALTAAFGVLTAVGAWCRGAGMRLVWPWNP